METKITPGIENSLTITVAYEHTAKAHESGLIEVFATPAMIGFMEKTAQLAIQPLLPEGYITLGTMVNVKHIKATPMGEKVTVHAKVTQVEGNKITFEVSAQDEQGTIGLGTHKRAAVHSELFIKSLHHD
ncbi:MAG: hypothetical protein CSA95_06910 [Bacteroidetes bacterium]|nr:MAG: hypothetical protein CSA95_06910 [Bacteroidota bacterium]PIE88414.1 MAG: hypothetical protein CSA04_01990 [Bacteroidota bacterium]